MIAGKGKVHLVLDWLYEWNLGWKLLDCEGLYFLGAITEGFVIIN